MTPGADETSRALDIVVLNANSSEEITAMLGARAREAARPGTRITAIQPFRGPAAVEGWEDAYRSATAMLDRMADFAHPFDALIMAGFGDVGREGLAEAVGKPVIDVTEAGAIAARLIGEHYAIVTTTARMIPLVERSLSGSGHLDHCIGIVPMGLTIAQLRAAPTLAAAAFREAASHCIERGAKALCVGSSALGDHLPAFAAASGVPVIDPVAAAVGLAEVAANPSRASAAGARAAWD